MSCFFHWFRGGIIFIVSIVSIGAFSAEVSFIKDIAPILDANCVSCHGEKKQKSGLRLDSGLATLAGGDAGPVVVIGHPERSKLFELISLPADDEDIMPPKGSPLTAAQIATIQNWIAIGAPLAEPVAPAPVVADTPPRPTAFAELAATLPEPDVDTLARLKLAHAVVRPLDPSGRTLEINFSHIRVDAELLESLKRLAPNLLWLDLGDTGIGDAELVFLKPLTHLEKLDLRHTRITDQGLIHLMAMTGLRQLVLVGTPVSDSGLYRLGGIKSLERIYLWGSKATPEGGKRLANSIPGCVVNTGP